MLFNILSFIYLLHGNIDIDYLGTGVNQLKLNLLTNYNRDTIPIDNKTLSLNISLNINSISVNQEESEVYYDIWINYQWEDYQLKWDKQYWNVDTLTFNTNPDYETSVWIPDIILYNSVETPMSGLLYTRLNVNSDGYVIWTRSGKIKSGCDLILDSFPYDVHSCNLLFGSLNYQRSDLNISNAQLTLNNYNQNNEWILGNTYVNTHVREGYFDDREFSIIEYNINIQREPTFYETYLIFPIFFLATIVLNNENQLKPSGNLHDTGIFNKGPLRPGAPPIVGRWCADPRQ